MSGAFVSVIQIEAFSGSHEGRGAGLLKVFRFALAAVVLGALSASPAQAINIGLLGDQVDPPPSITDITFFDLTAGGCNVQAVTSGFFCFEYEVQPFNPDSEARPGTVIDSIDFRIVNTAGQYFTTGDINETLSAANASINDLPNLIASPLFADGVTLRLYDSSSLNCFPGHSDCRAEFFSDSPDVASVSIVGVNGVQNFGATAVPEPATLLLFGMGIIGLGAGRRFRRI